MELFLSASCTGFFLYPWRRLHSTALESTMLRLFRKICVLMTLPSPSRYGKALSGDARHCPATRNAIFIEAVLRLKRFGRRMVKYSLFSPFQPYLGKIPILTHIFQMGWNHQPVVFWFVEVRCWAHSIYLQRDGMRLYSVAALMDILTHPWRPKRRQDTYVMWKCQLFLFEIQRAHKLFVCVFVCLFVCLFVCFISLNVSTRTKTRHKSRFPQFVQHCTSIDPTQLRNEVRNFAHGFFFFELHG